MKIRIAAPFCAASLFLAACDGDPSQALAKAEPASGAALESISRGIADTVSLAGNAELVQRFCKSALGDKCPEDIKTKLEANGYADGGTGVDLANAFVVMVADGKDGNPDLASTDEDYLWAAYKVALAREPDEGGALGNLTFIKEGGGRTQMLRSLLESLEFKNLK